MTYHDALMTQLRSLVKLVRSLRARLRAVDEATLKPSLDLCRLSRRLDNASKVLDKLSYMSYLQQTQPTIQLLLTTSEFSGKRMLTNNTYIHTRTICFTKLYVGKKNSLVSSASNFRRCHVCHRD